MGFREKIEKDQAKKMLVQQREDEAHRRKIERLAWSYENEARKAVKAWARRVGAQVRNVQVELFITYKSPTRQLLRLSWEVDDCEFRGNFYEKANAFSPRCSTWLEVELRGGRVWYSAGTKHEIARVFSGEAAAEMAKSDYTNKMLRPKKGS